MAPRLKRIKTPEGYVNVYGGMLSYIGYWNYVYALKDYQGSTRVTLTSAYLKNTGSLTYSSSAQIDYYPFGLERSNTGQSSGGVFNSGTNPYLYSANEIDRLNGLHQYDFHARWLDAAVPGFSTPDPLSERHYNENPYAYCGLDPVNRIDPLGLDWYYNEDKGYQWFENMTSSNYRYGFILKGATWLYAGTSVYYADKNGDEYYGDEKGKLHKMSISEFTKWGSSSYSLYGFAASGYDGNSGNYYDDSDEGGGNAQGGRGGIENSLYGVGFAQGAASVATNARLFIEMTYVNELRLDRARSGNFSNPIKHKLRSIRNTGKALNKGGGALIVADIAMSGEIKPSHYINAAATLSASTGIGAILGGAWFLADFGTMGVNYLLGNGAVGLGDMINNSKLGKSTTIELYEGLY